MTSYSLVTDREQVKLDRWWESEGLNEARAECYTTLKECLNDLESSWHFPEMPVGEGPWQNESLKMFAAGLMPKINPKFIDVRRQRGHAWHDRSHPDFERQQINQRAKLSTIDWFALMMHSWLTELGREVGKPRPVSPHYNEVYSCMEEHQEIIAHEHSKNAPNRYRPLMHYQADEYFNKWGKVQFNHWVNEESLQATRTKYLNGMIASIEHALLSVPRKEEEEIRGNMHYVMAGIEPIFPDRIPRCTSYTPNQYNRSMLVLEKEWWAELHDMYVYGTTPSERYEYKQRAADTMAACIKQANPTSTNINAMHIAQWRFKTRHNQRWSYLLAGDEDQARRVSGETVGPSIWTTLHHDRARVWWNEPAHAPMVVQPDGTETKRYV